MIDFIFDLILSAFVIIVVVALCANSYFIEKYKSHKEKKVQERKKIVQPQITEEVKKEQEREKIVRRQIIEEIKEEQSEILYVNYQCFFSENTKDYPIVKIPKKNSPVKSHCLGKSKRRGYKENSFQLSIQKYFGNDYTILGDVHLNIGKDVRPFEPDIAMINKKTNQTIRIDIEIDEPYSGINRQPIHYKGKDYNRDNYFSDRGWIVVRFSEYQVHTQELSCLRFLALVIESIFPNNYTIPSELLSAKILIRDYLWNITKAQKWERENYREKYLGINTFGFVSDNIEIVGQDLTERELEEERLVKPTPSIEVNSMPCNSETAQTIKTNTPHLTTRPITPSAKINTPARPITSSTKTNTTSPQNRPKKENNPIGFFTILIGIFIIFIESLPFVGVVVSIIYLLSLILK